MPCTDNRPGDNRCDMHREKPRSSIRSGRALTCIKHNEFLCSKFNLDFKLKWSDEDRKVYDKLLYIFKDHDGSPTYDDYLEGCLDAVTNILCSLIKYIGEADLKRRMEFTEEWAAVISWWCEHKEMDRIREEGS